MFRRVMYGTRAVGKPGTGSARKDMGPMPGRGHVMFRAKEGPTETFPSLFGVETML